MRKMLNFLNKTRQLISSQQPLCIVIGNESCDLDSAISSLTLAYFYSRFPNKIPYKSNIITENIVPILNIKRNEFPLKTEVTYFLKKNGITEENLNFKDDLNGNILEKSKFILVDHHVSPYAEQTIAVFDHRPYDAASNLPPDSFKMINEVGSCSTLIGSLFLEKTDEIQNDDDLKYAFKLIYAPIILDTVNFSKEADKARPLDVKVTTEIEEILQMSDPHQYRELLLTELVKARSDISNLNPLQLLYKDMKIIRSPKKDTVIALPGYPILVKDYVKLESAEESVKQFATNENCSVVLLIGLEIINNSVKRDIGLVNFKDEVLFNRILNKIKNYENLDLQLSPYEDLEFLGGAFFKQNNLKASRKQLLPIVKSVLDEL